MLETNIIYNEDCMNTFERLPDDSINMVLTDIPYGEVTKNGEERAKYSGQLRKINKGTADIINFDLIEFVNECIRVITDNIYIFCGFSQVSTIHKILDGAGLSTRLIIWEKTNPTPMNGQHLWLSGIEYAVYGRKAKGTFNASCRNTVLKYPNGRSKIHPTEKSLDLFKDLILTSSNKDDIIFDPCIGSGTTAVACYETGRKYIGCELDKTNYKNCIDRIDRETQQMKLFN